MISPENHIQSLQHSDFVQTNNRKMFFANSFLVVLFCVHEAITTTPVVLWHGLGSDHLDSIKQIIKENVDEDVYIKSIQLGMNAIEDTKDSIFIHPNDQISEVCLEIMRDENLKGGFNAIGFSQGSQFLWVLPWKGKDQWTFKSSLPKMFLFNLKVYVVTCFYDNLFSTLIKTRAHSTLCLRESYQFHHAWRPTSRDFRRSYLSGEELCDVQILSSDFELFCIHKVRK